MGVSREFQGYLKGYLDMHVQYKHPLPQVVQQALNNSLVLVSAVK